MVEKIVIEGHDISVISSNNNDYISLTDMAKKVNFDKPRSVIQNWIRNKDTIEFLGIWEQLYNERFNRLEFEAVKGESGYNKFVLSPTEWIRRVDSIGITTKPGRHNSGTFAHKDIAFEFASWISPGFKLYLIKEFDRLKQNEYLSNKTEWNIRRMISKTNYAIHTDAIKQNIITNIVSKNINLIYASEADILNLAVFGITAAEWKKANKGKKGNVRDYTTIEQLIILSNIESYNSILINKNISKENRLKELNKIAIKQMNALTNANFSNKK